MPQPAPDALAGRVILIVGAGGGLGRATALAAAQTGAQLVLLDRRVPALEALHDAIAAQGLGKPALYPLNLERATAQDYADLAARIGAELGRLDGIAFCAARFDGLMPLELVQRVIRLVEISEYKRQQAAPVLKVSKKSFGMGRRFPIAARRGPGES